MPASDSIIKLVDTTARLTTDTLAVSDSLSKADSIASIDSIKLAASLPPSGMEGIKLASLPANESWVFIVLLVLFLFYVGSLLKSGGEFLQNLRSTFKHNYTWGTSSVSTLNYLQSRILIILCSVGIFSLLIQEFLFVMPGNFELKTFFLSVGVTSGFYLLKLLLFQMVGNVFFDKKTVLNYQNIYFNFLSLFGIVLLPVLFLYTYQPLSWKLPLEIITGLLLGCFYVLLIIKLCQVFYTKKLALFYIFLYLCTLEILPLLVLFRVYELVI